MKNSINSGKDSQAHPLNSFLSGNPVLKEFLRDQVPMVFGVFALGILASYLQHGFVPGGDVAFPIAGIRVPLWHLIWMGFWTGYLMAIVGEASGIFSLPYSMSVLDFTSTSVSPTSLITTFLNPFGALFGYWRGKQWNLDLALWLCVGAILGSPIGPFIRVYWLNDEVPFKAVIGLVLFGMSVNLWIQTTNWYLKRTTRQREFKERFDAMMQARLADGEAPSGLPTDFSIDTEEWSWKRLTISYWGERQSFSVPALVGIGFIVGIVASALGVGGGFMLVPIMVSFYGLPMYVLVAGTIPFVIVLSITGLISYTVTLPLLTGISTSPDWSFGLFVATGAIFGAWLGSKTQKYIPEKYLKNMLGAITGLVGILYVANYFWSFPFKI